MQVAATVVVIERTGDYECRQQVHSRVFEVIDNLADIIYWLGVLGLEPADIQKVKLEALY